MTSIETAILSLIEYGMMMLLASFLISMRKEKIVRIIMYMVVGGIAIYLNDLLVSDPSISHVVSTVISILWIRSYTRIKNWNDLLLVYILTGIFIFVLEFCGVMIVGAIDSNFDYSFKYGLISQSISLILVAGVSVFLPINNLHGFIKNRNMLFRMLVINIYVIYFFASMLWFSGINSIVESKIGMMTMIMFTLLMNTIFLREGLLNQANEEQLRTFKTYQPIIDTLMEELRAKQHDYHNHIQSLISMKENEKLYDEKEFDRYISELIKDDILSYLVKIDHKIVMALLYNKYKIAEDKGIRMVFKIQNYSIESKHSDSELVEMYGILLDNAIEATERLDVKRIEIEIDTQGEMNIFIIKNTADYVSVADVNKMFGYGISNKEGKNRGIGLHKLKGMLNKKRGTITASYDTHDKYMLFEVRHF